MLSLFLQITSSGEVFFRSLQQQDLPKIMLSWSGSLERIYYRVDQSENMLVQVATLIAERNSDLAAFQPNFAVVTTQIFALYIQYAIDDIPTRLDNVSCYHYRFM